MFDIWYGGIELTTLTLILSVLLLFPFQIFLCFKVKSLFLRLLPVMLLGAACGWFLILSFAIGGWDSLGYTVLAIFSGFMLLTSAIGWGVWALCLWHRKKT